MFTTSLTQFGRIAARRLGIDGRANDVWFDWSTVWCSAPIIGNTGRSFDFTAACRRHDFGYRNYKALGTFSANKSRLDSAFYEDLKRVCAGYSGASKTACNSTAWTYYQAVKALG